MISGRERVESSKGTHPHDDEDLSSLTSTGGVMYRTAYSIVQRAAVASTSPSAGQRAWHVGKHVNQQTRTSSSDSAILVFGASTDVGKTIISAGLCRAALAKDQRVAYIKPVQTGRELDEYFVREYTNPQDSRDIQCHTLFRWRSRVSPHLATTVDGKQVLGVATITFNIHCDVHDCTPRFCRRRFQIKIFAASYRPS